MYSFEYDYEDNTTTTSVQTTVSEEADLTSLLTAFGYFLQAAGFTYVTHIYAVKDDGDACASTI